MFLALATLLLTPLFLSFLSQIFGRMIYFHFLTTPTYSSSHPGLPSTLTLPLTGPDKVTSDLPVTESTCPMFSPYTIA
jgi:hypothetical protein